MLLIFNAHQGATGSFLTSALEKQILSSEQYIKTQKVYFSLIPPPSLSGLDSMGLINSFFCFADLLSTFNGFCVLMDNDALFRINGGDNPTFEDINKIIVK